jgi:hypothetical protein
MKTKHLKTDMLLTVAFKHGSLEIYHKSEMGNLKQLFDLGNRYRFDSQDSMIDMNKFLDRSTTKKFIEIIMKENECSREDVIKVTGRGRGRKTLANLQFLIYCAMKLSDTFQLHVINSFIENEILVNRDIGGELYKDLCEAIDTLEDRKDKSNKFVYINVATTIRSEIFTISELNKFGNNKNIWNYATSEHYKRRITIEGNIVNFIKVGMIKNFKDDENCLQDMLPIIFKL